MTIEQIYTGCLAHAAYYVESQGEAIIIDPLREPKPYLDRAAYDGAKIKYIFETHFHADFVSGHKDLAEKSGAKIVYGPTDMKTGFEKIIATDGEVFKLGNISLEVIHTPGHTLESSCFLLRDSNEKEFALFTGDTLFIGDVGRPDLAQKLNKSLSQDKLARLLFHSLRDKIMPLSDDIVIYPAHGQGSACGKNMSKERHDLLGNQKKTNYALRADMTEQEFVKEVLDGLQDPPSYFPQNVLLNINGYDNLDQIIKKSSNPYDVEQFEKLANETEAIILDTRSPAEFEKSHVPNSVFIGIDGSFASWVGTLIPDVNQKILIVAKEDRLEEVITRLARVGYDRVIGYLNGGIKAWEEAGKELDYIINISPKQLSELHYPRLIDVREKGEYVNEHMENAIHIPLSKMNEGLVKVGNEITHVYCAGGYRSLIYISILQSRGYRNLINIKGGYTALRESERFEVIAQLCRN